MSSLRYNCLLCEKSRIFTKADMADAKREQAETLTLDPTVTPAATPTELIQRFGRNICPTCTGDKVQD